jgi:hypothetical protein
LWVVGVAADVVVAVIIVTAAAAAVLERVSA